MGDEYTREHLEEDLQWLIDIGLVEVKAITEDGKWLYGPTDKMMEIGIDEARKMIIETLESGDEN